MCVCVCVCVCVCDIQTSTIYCTRVMHLKSAFHLDMCTGVDRLDKEMTIGQMQGNDKCKVMTHNTFLVLRHHWYTYGTMSM